MTRMNESLLVKQDCIFRKNNHFGYENNFNNREII